MVDVKKIPVETRKAVFKAVVDAEDSGALPPDARKVAAEQFSLTLDQVRSIEAEGVDKTWPPLEEC